MMEIILILLGGYLFGSIPFAVIVSKIKGVNIYEVGTGNPGAANVYREVGKKYGILVWILDTVKGIIPMIIGDSLGKPLILIAGIGAAAIVGHCFSLFLKFKGGKGVATMGGVIIYLFPLIFPIGAILYFWVQGRERKPSLIMLSLLIFFLIFFAFYSINLITFQKNFYLPSTGLEIVISMLVLLIVAILANISTIKEVRQIWRRKEA